MVFLGNKVRNVLDVLFKAHPFVFRHQCDTWLVALPFRAPVVGVDGEFARCLDVNASHVTDSEIDSCLVSDIILGGGLSYKCGNFHYASSLVYHFHTFCFHKSNDESSFRCWNDHKLIIHGKTVTACLYFYGD